METSIEYVDTCLISRSEGEVDEYGDEKLTEVYSGEALLQVSGTARFDGFQFEHEPIVFIPVNNKLFKINDKVDITTWNGRETTYTIREWEAIKDDDIPELNNTCIWLKDGIQV